MNGLTLLSPTGLWLLTLVGPLVLLYVLKVRRKRAVVSSTWLWSKHARDLVARSPFRKLVAERSLLLQILALVALALAVARPASLGAVQTGGHIAIVVDVSASMGATAADGSTAIDRAKRAAAEIVEGVAPGTRVMVVEAGADPRVRISLDPDTARSRAAIDALRSFDVEGDLEGAVALAVDRLASVSDPRVFIVTDGHLAKPLSLQASAVPVEVVRVGEAIDNAAIVRTDVRIAPDSSGGEKAEALVVVASFGETPRDVFVTVRRDDDATIVDSRRLRIAPGERSPVTLAVPVTGASYGSSLTFEVSPKDALKVDDTSYAVVPPGARMSALIVGAPLDRASWVERALASDPNVTVSRAATAQNAADSALVVVYGACPAQDTPGGDLVIVAPPPGACFGVTIEAPTELPLVTSWDTTDSRMRFLSLDGLFIREASTLIPPSSSMALLSARQGALIADASTPTRGITILGFDPGESDWPLKSSFVLFVRNLTELARTHRARDIAIDARTGSPLRVAIDGDVADVTVTDPSGESVDVVQAEGALIVPTLVRAGLYSVTTSPSEREVSADRRTISVNLSSASESDLSSVEDFSDMSGVAVRDDARSVPAHREYAWLFALLALGVLLVEVTLSVRKPNLRRRPARRDHAVQQEPLA